MRRLVAAFVAAMLGALAACGGSGTASTPPSTSSSATPTGVTTTSATTPVDTFARDWIRRVDAVKPPSTSVCDEAQVRLATCGSYIADVATVVADLEKALPASSGWDTTRAAIDTLLTSAKQYVDLGCMRGEGTVSDCRLAATLATNTWPVVSGLMKDGGLS
ncbi:hypothetical protein [Saccharothrix sp.]|uniref:hypothetical protein n=1 Tax=Saccharothrix sp. TaxID=1873460 RepID=UPI0028118F0A|nr:hypothetical protein [Saccharothrix sp.]